jgi:stage II sporulation protein GA (sporulation sigma-E factor processing peptidase)
MIIYAEYLFLENFITGLLLLYFTSRITTSKLPAVKRILAGGILCGISSFLIFLPMGGAVAIILRCTIAWFIISVTLGLSDSLRKSGVFMILSFLSGSMVLAVFIWLKIPALSGNGFLYVESLTYIQLILIGLPAMGCCRWFVKLIRKKRGEAGTYGDAEVLAGGKSYIFRAMVDTGNGLKDPITGKMVILLDRKGREGLEPHLEHEENRAVLIPYQAVGTDRGVLSGIRIEELRFNGRKWNHVVIAFYEGKFHGYEVLLNQEIMEGGLLEHV